MKKLGVAVAIMGVLLLGGCASADTAESAPASTEASEALPVETPSPTPTPGTFLWEDYTPEQLLVEIMTKGWQGADPVPSESELVTLAQEACAQAATGIPNSDIMVLPGDSPETKANNTLLVVNGTAGFCP